ncbi:MAG: penicillin-binding protein 2 [Lysobacteraceae bacterium SCN 69-123]|uniref:penicillin-binding protein 2 n=1 Tax=Stenotrophomonas acidaminiphila TaxID=128780 RepID=UPI00086A4B90|nr:penicillin-binding protein 2 [Stenotrophomonas acidaminiphila]MBN8802801.1 penicillin-binding protein 2 [Stenotrophomonas acidaminiphila]MDF9441500.1 penicillin-binding protein 2 [Stenotrophomonas acidaminiphila]ODU42208.1 MAG: penicillin-binding protein 2 [Xanthomonadaceae bacterium SCN 69-123]OJY78734.1 MAG: penicillin-binding protein 2 [Stenotrophomonas sp. 69-14]
MYGRRQHKNPQAEAEQFRRRAAVGFLGVLLGLGVLAGWYFKLQVLDHDVYATRSEANRIKARPVVPGRGLIYDRKGRLLAENVPAFRLDVTPNKVQDMAATLDGLRAIFALSDEDIERFNQSRKARRSFIPVTLKLRVSDEEMARFAVDRWRYPGVELEPYLTRRYPYGDLLAHVIGYVGRVDDKDLQELGEGNAALTHIGKSGLERYYEDQLRGKVGYERVETNVQGRAIRTLGRVPAQSGADLRLSIDVDLQQAMVTAFGEQEGSAVAIDPRTGEILAMVSLPSYDPNLFVNGISHADFKRLNENPSRPQFNRLVLGGVAPGSTVKPFLGLAGLDSGLRRPEDKILSRGMFYLPGVSRGWGDANRGGHGWTDLRKSISQSVNTYYYQLGTDMGVERYDQYMGGRYGFGQPTGIDLAGEIGGILPSPAAKARLRKERWYPGDMVNASIGQGLWKVTPLQLVRGVGGLASGQLRRPHLVVEQKVGFDHDWAPLPQPESRPISPNPANLQAVREGMMGTMQPGGSGWRVAAGAPYLMAGKTGTAQVVSRKGTAAVNPKNLPMHLRHRALFIGFAPAEDPRIAIAVAVEGGGYGGAAAAPIARKVFDAWLLGVMPDVQQAADASGVVEGAATAGSAAPAPAVAPPGEPLPTPVPSPASSPEPAQEERR